MSTLKPGANVSSCFVKGSDGRRLGKQLEFIPGVLYQEASLPEGGAQPFPQFMQKIRGKTVTYLARQSGFVFS